LKTKVLGVIACLVPVVAASASEVAENTQILERESELVSAESNVNATSQACQESSKTLDNKAEMSGDLVEAVAGNAQSLLEFFSERGCFEAPAELMQTVCDGE
jgi:hypothetical protein